MSNVIKASRTISKVFIGEKHHDEKRESQFLSKLGKIFPLVSVVSDINGAKSIPVEEIENIEKMMLEKIAIEKKLSFDQGKEQGLREGLKKAEDVLEKFDTAISNAVNQRANMLDEAREKILELVMQISKKVTFDAIEVDPKKTALMINRVIDTLIDRSRIIIKVNPSHLPIIEQNIDQFLKNSTSIKELKIEADPRVQYGGCFIETPTGDIDARLESQFEVIEEVLRIEEES